MTLDLGWLISSDSTIVEPILEQQQLPVVSLSELDPLELRVFTDRVGNELEIVRGRLDIILISLDDQLSVRSIHDLRSK